MAVKDSEEATLYSVVLQDITQLYGAQLWGIEYAPVHERVHTMRVDTKSTL